jgi:hypothetical protein
MTHVSARAPPDEEGEREFQVCKREKEMSWMHIISALGCVEYQFSG